jgi:hypothetical protein
MQCSIQSNSVHCLCGGSPCAVYVTQDGLPPIFAGFKKWMTVTAPAACFQTEHVIKDATVHLDFQFANLGEGGGGLSQIKIDAQKSDRLTMVERAVFRARGGVWPILSRFFDSALRLGGQKSFSDATSMLYRFFWVAFVRLWWQWLDWYTHVADALASCLCALRSVM